MNNTIKKLLLAGLTVTFCATAVDLAAMKRGAGQDLEEVYADVINDNDNEDDAQYQDVVGGNVDWQQPVAQQPVAQPQPIAQQPVAQQQQEARSVRFVQGKRHKVVELPIAGNFEKRNDGWYYNGYCGGRWDNAKIKKAEILEALNAADAAVNQAVDQVVAQAPQDLQAAAQNNNQQFEARITQVEQQLQGRITQLEQQLTNNNVNSAQLKQDLTQHTQELALLRQEHIQLKQEHTQLKQESDKLVQTNQSLNRKVKYMFITGLGFVAIVVVAGAILYFTWPQILSWFASALAPLAPVKPLGPVQKFIVGISEAKEWLFTCRPFSWL